MAIRSVHEIGFYQARAGHCSFLAPLARFLFLDEDLPCPPWPSYDDCLLNEQIEELGTEKSESSPMKTEVVRLLAREHADLHQLAQDVIDLKAAGDALAAEWAFRRIPQAAEKLLRTLATVEDMICRPPLYRGSRDDSETVLRLG